MNPEEKARLIINQKLEDAGWKVVSRDDFSPIISAVAIEEGVLEGNLEADYLLFLDGKAIGVLEAKKADCNLSEIVAQQAENYTKRLLKWYQSWQNPLPFVYLSNGRELLFRDLRNASDPFNTIFVTERIKSAYIPPESNVVISTIQRLFAVLTGKEITEDDDNEESRETESDEIIELGNNINLPSDFFDVIIVDECHRSIYGRWQKVLTYFNHAKIIGLTATPISETLAFFNNNLVVNYTLEKSIADGVNLDYRTYRIQTEASTYG